MPDATRTPSAQRPGRWTAAGNAPRGGGGGGGRRESVQFPRFSGSAGEVKLFEYMEKCQCKRLLAPILPFNSGGVCVARKSLIRPNSAAQKADFYPGFTPLTFRSKTPVNHGLRILTLYISAGFVFESFHVFLYSVPVWV